MRFERSSLSHLMPVFALLLLTFTTSQAFADELTKQLTEKFKARVSKLDRELVTFRYEVKSSFEPQTIAEISNHLEGWTQQFFDRNMNQGYIAGPGVYVAIDPVASRSFGATAPQLYVLPLKKGTITLNLEGAMKADETDLIKAIYEKHQCKSTYGDDQQRDFFALRNSATESCRDVAIEVARSLNVQAILYSYSAADNLENCRPRSAAINVIANSAINYARAAYYSDERSLEQIPIGPLVKKIYQEGSEDFALLMSTTQEQKMPKQLEIQSDVNPELYEKWKRVKILSCGRPSPVEEKTDRELYAIIKILKTSFTDKEIHQLLVKLRDLASKKSGSQQIYIYNFVLPVKLSFKISGLPQDEKTFRNWGHLIQNAYTPEKIAELKKLVGLEKVVNEIEDIEPLALEYFKNLPVAQKQQADLYIKFLIHLGFPKAYAISMQNEYIRYLGGAVLSKIDDSKTITENIAINKDIYKAELRKCIDLYSDPKITYESINETDCSFRGFGSPE